MSPPDNDNDRFADYVYGVLDCTMEEFFGALHDSGSEVEFGLLSEGGEFLPQAND